MGPPVEVSFCATNLNTEDRLPASIASIRAIGVGLGVPFEIVVADGPGRGEARAWLIEEAARDSRLRVVANDQANRGRGRRLAFEASTGSTIIPFDTSIEYDVIYAGLLARWRERARSRMLFSEICAMPREAVVAVGGWRDLVGGEDIDLYGRLIRRVGLVAFPTPLRASQSARMGAAARQLRYAGGSGPSRWHRLYVVQRDQIVGAGYRVSDLMAFNASKPALTRLAYRLFFTAAAWGARLGRLRPAVAGLNNYLFFREEIFRSLLEGRHAALGWDGPGPILLLTEDEIGYLDRRSEVWRSERARLSGFVQTK